MQALTFSYLYPLFFKLHVRWLPLNTRPVVGLALKGRCKQRSNLLPADLSPQSLTQVSSWRFTRSPPACNSNYLGYI
nr:hypothetical protein B7L52_10250 [Pectobacterium carotovorum]